MTKKYEYDNNATFDKNLAIALFAVANEMARANDIEVAKKMWENNDDFYYAVMEDEDKKRLRKQ